MFVLFLSFFFWSNVGDSIEYVYAPTCTNRTNEWASKPAIDCDLSMSIYNEKLSICAWHVGILYVQFHKWWNSDADVNKRHFIMTAVAEHIHQKWVAVFSLHNFFFLLFIALETKFYQNCLGNQFFFLFIKTARFCSGLLFSEPSVMERQTIMTTDTTYLAMKSHNERKKERKKAPMKLWYIRHNVTVINSYDKKWQ